MNASCIRLTRIIAFNWYGFRTFIDVSGLTLLCGETGTGKSALLDLIQFVISAGSVKFNKAATGESNARDLRSYCLCDTRTRLRDGQKRYLRHGGATVAALEFTWPKVPGEDLRQETWGIRVQYESPSAQPSYVRFHVPSRMERSDLCDETGSLLSEDVFRWHVKNELNGDAGFTSHKAFQEEMGVARHLNFDDEQMRKTLPKAIAFELDTDYQRFIREFILEPSPPNIAHTRLSLEALRHAELRVNQLVDQQLRLKKIAEADLQYQTARREAALFGHLRHSLNLAETQERLARIQVALQSLRDKHADNKERMTAAVSAKVAAQRDLDEVRLIAGGTNQNLIELDRLTRMEQEQTEEIERLVSKAKTAREFLADKAKAWEGWLSRAALLSWEVSIDRERVKTLRDADTSRALDEVSRLCGEFHKAWDASRDKLEPKVIEIDNLTKDQSRLKDQLVQLKEKRTAPTPLLDRLHSRGVKAQTLARVVEVSSFGEPWWGVIEALLHDDCSAVLIESGDYPLARELWEAIPNAEPLIHPEKIPSISPTTNAFATLVETNHSVARKFLDWRLGQIAAVRQASDLEDHFHAATPLGEVKEGPVFRHLTVIKELTLGEEGLRRLQIEKQAQCDEVSQRLEKLKRIRDDVYSWLQSGKSAGLDKDDPPDGCSEIHHLSDHREQLQRTKKAIKFVENPELKKRLAQLRILEAALEGANQTIGALRDPITKFEIEEKRLLDDLETVKRELRDVEIRVHENRTKLPSGIFDEEVTTLLAEAIASPASWKQRHEKAELAQNARNIEASDARNSRQQQRRDLLTHSEHADEFREFDGEDESNAEFDRRLVQIREHDVEHYKSIAADRRADWEKRLQEDVIDSLSEKLKDARKTIDDFRRILNREIGGYRYKLSQTRDPIHRGIWRLIDQSDEGLQAGDALHDWKLQAEVDEAKREMMHALDNPEDTRAALLLDYRNYHRYDLVMIPAGYDDDTEGKISLQESGATGSGGEGQAPFFVAMLAAFCRVYDRGQRGSQCSSGLVVMDEAFSKLSAGHIADCLALAEGFGLQLVLAFPMDRLGTMVQHADSIIQCRVEKRTDNKGVPVQIINDIIYWDRSRAAGELFS